MITETLPTWLAAYFPIFSMMVVGYVVEKHYVSRVTTFTNSLAIVVFVITHNVGKLVGLYADIGLLLGLVGLQAYHEGRSLDSWYYEISAHFYSSAVAAAVILYPKLKILLSGGNSPELVAFLIVAMVFFLNAAAIDSDETLIYVGERPYQVNEFIAKAKVKFPHERNYHSISDWFKLK